MIILLRFHRSNFLSYVEDTVSWQYSFWSSLSNNLSTPTSALLPVAYLKGFVEFVSSGHGHRRVWCSLSFDPFGSSVDFKE